MPMVCGRLASTSGLPGAIARRPVRRRIGCRPREGFLVVADGCKFCGGGHRQFGTDTALPGHTRARKSAGWVRDWPGTGCRKG